MMALQSMLLDEATGDLALVNGTTQTVTGAAQARQRIAISLDIFLGEWFLDIRIGVPYHRDILIKNPNPEVVRSVFRKALLLVPGIVEVTEIEVTLNKATRAGRVDFVAVYEDGTAIPGNVPFII
jgi:hypothetical protein